MMHREDGGTHKKVKVWGTPESADDVPVGVVGRKTRDHPKALVTRLIAEPKTGSL
jgi:hypothetical protein